MDNVRVIGRENNNYRRKIKEAIQIYKRQPALNRDQGMEIPAITLKLLSCGPTGSHDEWRQPTHIPLKMAARCSPKIREHIFFSFKTQYVVIQLFLLWILSPITYFLVTRDRFVSAIMIYNTSQVCVCYHDIQHGLGLCLLSRYITWGRLCLLSRHTAAFHTSQCAHCQCQCR